MFCNNIHKLLHNSKHPSAWTHSDFYYFKTANMHASLHTESVLHANLHTESVLHANLHTQSVLHAKLHTQSVLHDTLLDSS